MGAIYNQWVKSIISSTETNGAEYGEYLLCMWKSSEEESEKLSCLPQQEHERISRIARIDFRTAIKNECAVLCERISKAWEIKARAMFRLWLRSFTETSRRLFKASRCNMAMSAMSFSAA